MKRIFEVFIETLHLVKTRVKTERKGSLCCITGDLNPASIAFESFRGIFPAQSQFRKVFVIGKAIPESDTLVSISEYFHVTLVYLMKENDAADSESEPVVSNENDTPSTDTGKVKRILGIVICVSGIVFLIIWGLVSVFIPSTSNQISESSMITIDGNGVFLIICLAAIIAGAVLLLKSTSNK